jgi:hypothetical protein
MVVNLRAGVIRASLTNRAHCLPEGPRDGAADGITAVHAALHACECRCRQWPPRWDSASYSRRTWRRYCDCHTQLTVLPRWIPGVPARSWSAVAPRWQHVASSDFASFPLERSICGIPAPGPCARLDARERPDAADHVPPLIFSCREPRPDRGCSIWLPATPG